MMQEVQKFTLMAPKSDVADPDRSDELVHGSRPSMLRIKIKLGCLLLQAFSRLGTA
jgi:hypothetical protein